MIAVNAFVVTWRHLRNVIELLRAADDELKVKVPLATYEGNKPSLEVAPTTLKYLSRL